MDMTQLPVLSLETEKSSFAGQIGDSMRRFGFAMVADHGIERDLIARGWELTRQFFALPEEEKRRYHIAGQGGARGYTPFGTEIAKGAEKHDLKEFWHVGRELAPCHPGSASMPPNVWPEDLPGFRETFTELFAAFDHAGNRILSAIALALDLPDDWFDPVVFEGNSVMRLLHYPPLNDSEPGAIRAGAHGDINLITLLLGAEEAGLELLDRDGQWITVDPPEGALVINIGDMLERLTNHVLPSTTHRVRNPESTRAAHSRYSMPFFLHPRSDFVIRSLPRCITPDRPDRYPVPITADEFLQQRLREIGLRVFPT